MLLRDDTLLLLALLLLAAGLAGAFARLLRLPVVPVQLLFGGLLAHGPSAVMDAPAAAALGPLVGVALGIAALVLGTRWRAPTLPAPAAGPATPAAGSRASVALPAHVLMEIALVPPLVWFPLAVLAWMPSELAYIVGLLALASAADGVEAAARRWGAHGAATGRALGAVARLDSVASVALVLLATLFLRARTPVTAAPAGPALPLVLLSLALGISFTFSAPGLLARCRPWLDRAHNLALGTLGVYAGAVVATASLRRGLLIALLVCSLRAGAKWAAARWSQPRTGVPAALRHVGAALAPGGLFGVSLILFVRDEPAFAGFRELFLAVGVCMVLLDSTLGSWVARRVFRRALAPSLAATITPPGPPAAGDGTPPAR